MIRNMNMKKKLCRESNNSSKVSDDWYGEREREYRVVLDRETERDRGREREGGMMLQQGIGNRVRVTKSRSNKKVTVHYTT